MKFLNAFIQYGILLFVFLIPWQARLILVPGTINGGYWEYGTQSLYATEAMLFVLLVAIIARGVLAIRHKAPNFSVRTLYSPFGFLAVLVAWSALSIMWSVDHSVALDHWTMLLEAAIIFLAVSSGVVPFNRLLWTIIASGFAQATIGIAQSLLQVIPASTLLGTAHQSADMLGTSVVETANSRWLRPYGTFPHPNILGGWLALSLISVLAATRSLVIEAGERIDRTIMMRFAIRYLVFAVLLFGLLATYSRSAWLAAFVGMAVFFTLSMREKKCRKSGILLAAIGAVVLIVFGILFKDQFLSRVIGQNRLEVKSSQEREASLAQSWDIITRNKVLGTGIGNYGLAVHEQIDADKPAYYYQPTHNVFLLMWAELGMIGLLLMVVCALYVFNTLYFRIKKREAIGTGMMFLLPLVTIALFDHYLWSLYAGMMMGAVYLGIFYLKLAKK